MIYKVIKIYSDRRLSWIVYASLVLFPQSICSDRDNVMDLSHCRLHILEIILPEASVFWLRTSISQIAHFPFTSIPRPDWRLSGTLFHEEIKFLPLCKRCCAHGDGGQLGPLSNSPPQPALQGSFVNLCHIGKFLLVRGP